MLLRMPTTVPARNHSKIDGQATPARLLRAAVAETAPGYGPLHQRAEPADRDSTLEQTQAEIPSAESAGSGPTPLVTTAAVHTGQQQGRLRFWDPVGCAVCRIARRGCPTVDTHGQVAVGKERSRQGVFF